MGHAADLSGGAEHLSKRKKQQQAPPSPTLIYVGPTIQHGRLTQNTVFRDGFPSYLDDLLQGDPDIELLIVPVQQLVATRIAAATPGTPQHTVYQRLLKGVGK